MKRREMQGGSGDGRRGCGWVASVVDAKTFACIMGAAIGTGCAIGEAWAGRCLALVDVVAGAAPEGG